jgi:hypothetical protein
MANGLDNYITLFHFATQHDIYAFDRTKIVAPRTINNCRNGTNDQREGHQLTFGDIGGI